jgi:hypothetical protein
MNQAQALHEERIRLLKATATLQRLSAQHQVARLQRMPALYLAAWSMGMARHGTRTWLMKVLPRPYRLLAASWPVLQHLLSLSRKYHEERQDVRSPKPERHLPH